MKSNIDYLVDDILSQIQLAITIKQRGYIGVFIAKQNLISVHDEFTARFNKVYGLECSGIIAIKEWLLNQHRMRIDLWQKPDPFPAGNHLTLTVGSYTAIIFDYEVSVYEY